MTRSTSILRLTPWVDDPTWGGLFAWVAAWLWARQQGMRIVLGPGVGARFRAQAQWLGLDWDDVALDWSDLDVTALEAVRSLLSQGRARLVQFETGEIIWWRVELVDHSSVTWRDLLAGPTRQSPGSGWGLYVALMPNLSGGRPGAELLALLADRSIGVTHVLGSADERQASARYLALAQTFGYEPPCLAHFPAVPHDMRVNLSQLEREGYHGPAVAIYAASMGELPPRSGRCPTLSDLVPLFDLDQAARRSLRFDPQRLLAFNKEYAEAYGSDVSPGR